MTSSHPACSETCDDHISNGDVDNVKDAEVDRIVRSRGKDGFSLKTNENALVIDKNKISNNEINILSLPPKAAYELYIGAADSGDPDAQYFVSKVLERCQGGVRSKADLDRLLARGDLNEELINHLSNKYEMCSELFNLLEGIDIFERRVAWLQSAAYGGNIYAKLEYLSDYGDPANAQKEMLPLIYIALKESK